MAESASSRTFKVDFTLHPSGTAPPSSSNPSTSTNTGDKTLYLPANTDVLSSFSLHGKVAAVTGGSRGIGLEICIGLIEAGASVAVISTREIDVPESIAAALERTKASAGSSDATDDARSARKARCATYKADVSNSADISSTLEKIYADFSRLDIVVANAGIAAESESANTYDVETYRKVMAINLDGAFYTAQATGRIFARQRQQESTTRFSGSLIFTSSVSALLVNLPQRQAAYNASKAGVSHLARCLAVEWAQDGLGRVNIVSPGFIKTDMLDTHPKSMIRAWVDMVPGGRMAVARELKGVFVFLASEAASYVTGAEVVVDGGYTLP